tara:strand:+ start:18085 stop:19749 length:1665 start_codon:yes stop_codon:yes gene_type:complete
MQKFNIILVVIDAVRSIDTGLDERDRLKIFSDLKERGYLEFDKMVVSGPSSVMSAVSMLTGTASFKLARNYNDFRWERGLYNIVNDELSDLDYSLHGLFGTKEMRDKMKQVFPPIQNNLLPGDMKLSQKKWTNEQLYRLVDNYFNNLIIPNDSPFFLMTWFNSRFDYQTSEVIDRLVTNLEEQSFYDNTLLMITSDHGYPDQRRGLASDGVDLQAAGMKHDMIVTDDNITVPFAVKFPEKIINDNKEIKKLLSKKETINSIISQGSIAPTIYEVNNIQNKDFHFNFEQKSIIDFLSNKDSNVIYRTDARFIFQPNRVISIRGKEAKFVIDHDNQKEYFYDLAHDENESYELLNLSDENYENILRESYSKSESHALSVWRQRIEESFSASWISHLRDLSEGERINIIFLGFTIFIVPVINAIENIGIKVNLYVTEESSIIKIQKLLNHIEPKLYEGQELKNSLVIIEDTLSEPLLENLGKLRISKYLIMDINLKVSTSIMMIRIKGIWNLILTPLKKMMIKRELYKQEPRLLIQDISYLTKRAFQNIFLGMKRKY